MIRPLSFPLLWLALSACNAAPVQEADDPGPCVGFEDLELGAEFHVGDAIESEGRTMQIRAYEGPVGEPGPAGVVRVVPGEAGGTALLLRNAGVELGLPAQLARVTLRFTAHSRHGSLDINGDFFLIEDWRTDAPPMLGWVSVEIVSDPQTHPLQGEMQFEGVPGQLTLAAEDLRIDDVCLAPHGAAPGDG